MNQLGNSIRLLRQKYQMTQAELSQKLNVQPQTISKWENGISTPDATMLPAIADALDVSIDNLFNRSKFDCSRNLPDDKITFLLQTYSQMYAPEGGPWNLSVANKYLEYRFADFLEKNYVMPEHANICNIGIGAGEWDHYLSYQLKNGSLTSIDQLEICCRQLKERLEYERNPNDVRVICADATKLEFHEEFDLITIVGTTGVESGNAQQLLTKSIRFLKNGGSIYYQSLDSNEDCNTVMHGAFKDSLKLTAYLSENAYGHCCNYYMFQKI